MGVFDNPLFDINGDGKTDAMELMVGMQLTGMIDDDDSADENDGNTGGGQLDDKK